MEALRPKLVKRLESMMATVEHVAGTASGQLSHSSAGRIADSVLSITRAHDEDYARTVELADAFRRLPVQIRVNEAKAPFAEGYLDDESVAMLAAAAERDFAARQPDTGWGGDRTPEPDDVVDAHICCEHIDEDPELSAMAAIVRLMEAETLDGHAVIRALYPLDGPVVVRVLRWFLARYPADHPF